MEEDAEVGTGRPGGLEKDQAGDLWGVEVRWRQTIG